MPSLPPDIADFARRLADELNSSGAYDSLLVDQTVWAAVRIKLLLAHPLAYQPLSPEALPWDRAHDRASRLFFRCHNTLLKSRRSRPATPPQRPPVSSRPSAPSSPPQNASSPSPPPPQPAQPCPQPAPSPAPIPTPSSAPKPPTPSPPSRVEHPDDPFAPSPRSSRPRRPEPLKASRLSRLPNRLDLLLDPLAPLPFSATPPRASPP